MRLGERGFGSLVRLGLLVAGFLGFRVNPGRAWTELGVLSRPFRVLRPVSPGLAAVVWRKTRSTSGAGMEIGAIVRLGAEVASLRLDCDLDSGLPPPAVVVARRRVCCSGSVLSRLEPRVEPGARVLRPRAWVAS